MFILFGTIIACFTNKYVHCRDAAIARNRDRHKGVGPVSILRLLFSRRRRAKTIRPMQLHMVQWHRIFYTSVAAHIAETTAKKRDWA